MSKTASLKAENLSWFQVKKYLHSSLQRCRTLCPCTLEIAVASSLGSYKNLQLKNRKEKRVKKELHLSICNHIIIKKINGKAKFDL